MKCVLCFVCEIFVVGSLLWNLVLWNLLLWDVLLWSLCCGVIVVVESCSGMCVVFLLLNLCSGIFVVEYVVVESLLWNVLL